MIDLLLGPFLHLEAEGKIVINIHIFKDSVILKYQANIAPSGGDPIDYFIIENNISTRGLFQSREHVEGRCLTAS